MIKPTTTRTAANLAGQLENFWQLSGDKLLSLERDYDKSQGTPVFTVEGRYTTRGWTEWTEGFVYGSSVLQFDGTGDQQFLDIGRRNTVDRMATHVSHIGVHDHGFNNLSTYGNLLRLANEGRIEAGPWEREFYKLALKTSAAVQAARWTDLPGGLGYIYSFNGPHSLFIDTIRSCRILMVGAMLGHVLMGEGDTRIDLMQRALVHMKTSALHNVYFGEGRDHYDLRGRTAHEAIFNVNDGSFRCANSQQGFSGLTTWTRGLAWAMLGFAEELEFLTGLPESLSASIDDWDELLDLFAKSAAATCDFYLENTPTCGVPYWDTGAPNLHRLGDYLDRPAEPINDWEPVDSSAAAIGAQGLLRLGKLLNVKQKDSGQQYIQCGLQTAATLLGETYLSGQENHQGLLLHSIYHQPRGWDHVPTGAKIASGESCMWGDYHLRELAVYLQRMADPSSPYYTFFGCLEASS